jgi:hypothetical protein
MASMVSAVLTGIAAVYLVEPDVGVELPVL